jgi:hypothetical protein
VIIILAALGPQLAFALELSDVKDEFLVNLLNGYEVLAERKELPYAIRVLRLRDHGECDGTPQSCPQETLFVAVSEFGEYPDQKVFKLPKSYGWEFVSWKVLAKQEGRESFSILEVKEQVISKDASKGWWAELHFYLHVNPWKGFLKEVGK